MADDDRTTPPLGDLEARVRAARDAQRQEPTGRRAAGSAPPGLVGLAMRTGVELVAGVGVGALVGYGLDRWLGTSPWLLILCFVLGAAAGMLNAYRAVSGFGMALGYRGAGRQDGDGPDRGDG